MVENISYVIIGNGIAGATAAEILRTEDSAAAITIVADDAGASAQNLTPLAAHSHDPGASLFADFNLSCHYGTTSKCLAPY